MIEVYDNLLSEDMADMIENTLLCNEFPWYVQLKTVYDSEPDGMTREVPYMSHTFITEGVIKSGMARFAADILKEFYDKSGVPEGDMIRVMANLTRPSFGYPLPTPVHRDQPDMQHNVLIYYASDSDGETVIYDNRETRKIIKAVEPKKNRFLMFSGDYWHSAYLPTQHDLRVLINYNLALPNQGETNA